MDLGTVKKSIKIGKYKKVEECLDDLQLIWDNCKLYNSEGCWIYELAVQLEHLMLTQLNRLLPLVTFTKTI